MNIEMAKRKKADEVFGMSNEVLRDSYVDRGDLDKSVKRLLGRRTHIALRGASKCGKSWLRQTVLPEALVVQCRLNKTTIDIYRDALSQLEVRLEVDSTSGSQFKGTVEAQRDLGLKLLAKLNVKAAVEAVKQKDTRTKPVGHDITDLRFIADIKASERRIVIEDFHWRGGPATRRW